MIAALHLASTTPPRSWTEVSIRQGHVVPHSTPTTAAAALASGESVVLVPHVASQAECAAVVEACSGALDAGGRLVRLPSIAAAASTDDDLEVFAGDPSADAPLSQLPAEADAICQGILQRVLAAIDRELGPVAVSQFGTAALSELLAADELEFAAREPAVNVYAEGGSFPPHEDHQALTVLVPLSGHGGGGTGFWTSDAGAAAAATEEEDEEDDDDAYGDAYDEGGWYEEGAEFAEEEMDEEEAAEAGWARVSGAPPSTVLRAERGTAVLWSGGVLHAGTPVEHGARVVFVASFSGLRLWPDPWHRPLGAATYSVLSAGDQD